jgi:Leucine-rich repeat (LRR) protein
MWHVANNLPQHNTTQHRFVGQNLIGDLEDKTFHGLNSLAYLDLSYNLITTISANLLDDVPKLVTLILSGNQISTLVAGVFSGLTELQEM